MEIKVDLQSLKNAEFHETNSAKKCTKEMAICRTK